MMRVICCAIALGIAAGCSARRDDPDSIVPDVVASSTGQSGSSAAATVSGAASSGGDEPGDPGAPGTAAYDSSGARLKLVSYVGDDGFRQVQAQAYDAELGTYCWFIQSASGSLVCLPAQIASYTVYIDAACTRAAVAMSPCAPSDVTYVSAPASREGPASCDDLPYAAYKIVGPSQQSSYSITESGCERRPPDSFVYAEAQALPMDRLARVTIAVEP